jgi:hypothetical protein
VTDSARGSDLTEKISRASQTVTCVVVVSFLWLVTSLVLVTLPAATAGAHAAFQRYSATHRSGYVTLYFSVFRKSFRTITVPGVLLLLALVWFAANAAYYLLVREPSPLILTGGAIQLLAALAALAVAIQYFPAVGGFWADDGAGSPPGLRDAGRRVVRFPLATLVAALVTTAVPTVLVWLSLWHFLPFAGGIMCFLVLLVLQRIRT